MSTAIPKTTARGGKPHSILKNVTSNWASLLTNVLLTLFMAPFIVSKLGATYYGIWTLLMQFTAYLWLFDVGVRESVVKYVAQYHASGEHDKLASVVNAAVAVYSFVGAVTLAGALAMTYALPSVFNIPPDAVYTARMTMMLTGLTVAQAFMFNVYVGMLMGVQRFYLVARLGIFVSLARAALVLLLLSNGYGIIAMGVVHFGLSTATSLLVYRQCRVHFPYATSRFARPSREDIGKVVGYGKYVLVTNLGEKIVYATDSLVIGMFLPVASITYFAVAGSLVNYLKSFISAMAVVLNPISSSLETTNNMRAIERLVITSSKAAVLVGLPVCIGFIVLGERFITIWMGPEFGPTSGQVLAVLGTAYMFGLPQHTATAVLLGLGQHHLTAAARGFEAVVNLTLSIVLVQFYGLIGVAIGTLVPHVVLAVVIQPLALRRVLGIDLPRYYLLDLWTSAAGLAALLGGLRRHRPDGGADHAAGIRRRGGTGAGGLCRSLLDVRADRRRARPGARTPSATVAAPLR